MLRKLEVPTEDGSVLVVEVAEEDVVDDVVQASSSDRTVRSLAKFEDLLAQVEPALRAVAAWAGENAPDQCTVELGLKLGGETGIIIAKGTAEANFVVKLTWGHLSG